MGKYEKCKGKYIHQACFQLQVYVQNVLINIVNKLNYYNGFNKM